MAIEVAGQRSMRIAPEGWEEMSVRSKEVLTMHGSDSAGAEKLLEYLEPYDSEVVEANRYHGLDYVACITARAVKDPEVRKTAALHIGTSLRDALPRQIFSLEGIIGGNAGDFMAKVAIDGSKEHIPPHVQFLNKGLAAARYMRLTDPQGPRAQEYAMKRAVLSIVKSDAALETAGNDPISGALSVYRTALELRHTYLTGETLNKYAEFTSEPTASSVLAQGGLEPLNLKRIIRQCAALRLDEFDFHLGKYLMIDDNGVVQFDETRRVPVDQLESSATPGIPRPDQDVLHIGRMICPGLFVSGAMESITAVAHDAVAYAETLPPPPGPLMFARIRP
jgi:hypothetical protein